DRNRSHWSTSKTPSYTKSVSWQHHRNCVRGNGKLFNLKRKPWIMPDEVDVATVVKVIDTCPSGALKYRHK
ncbi:(4Fe-4S)-binding protein, partial [uncultured Escherichia sp.]|uniref:(4Fe-4S)-binding protein n=1 Tax=uncultured Escherichia sp. TaxID=237777 RepID=UPI0025992891